MRHPLAGPESMDEHTTDSTGGAFIPSVLDCPLPAGIDPEGARIEFIYEANDSGAITPMTLAVSQAYATNAWQQNTLPGRIRVWTKDADATRNPASVASGGDFVPSETLLPYEDVVTGEATQTVFYVEGIGTSLTWGGDKIKVRVYPCGAGQGWGEDQVSYTVVRCVYKVCVWRPYICHKDASGAVTNRSVFRTVYDTPRTMFSAYCYGQRFGDTSFHARAASMGHAFARLERRLPGGISEARWTGQTGMNKVLADFVFTDVYNHLKDGDWYWEPFTGEEDDPVKNGRRYQDYYVAPVTGSILTDGAVSARKMLAVYEYRTRVETAELLWSYRTGHPFRAYGLDTTLGVAPSPRSRVGCGSYVAILTERAGLPTAGWVVQQDMPIVRLATLPSTWLGLWDMDALLQKASDEFCDHGLHPETSAWGMGSSVRNLRFVDPGSIMDWCDAATQATPWSKDRCVGVRYDVPPASDLSSWRR